MARPEELDSIIAQAADLAARLAVLRVEAHAVAMACGIAGLTGCGALAVATRQSVGMAQDCLNMVCTVCAEMK